MSIEILASEVVDQISAGEVVERPAHMVKELIENGIDAGATEIEIEFAQGGRWVRVQDNGSGMAREDLEICLHRHATSKIKTSADIWNLQSFGFRGEALASISAVSRMTITTKQPDQEVALQLTSEFGKKSEVCEVGGETGTTFLVEELFENMPARLKFLKSEAAESTAIKNTLRALAMAHPEVGFRVLQKGKLLFYWPARESKKDRVEEVLEKAPLYSGRGSCEEFQAEVVVSSPHITVKNSRQIWLFVQDRWVQDRGLQAAVTEGYRSLLMHGEYPLAAVWLSCPNSDVDVNIHPTKSQVKFRDSSSAFRAIHRAVRSLLETAPWLKELLPETPAQELTKLHSSDRIVPTPMTTPEVSLSFKDQDLNRVQFAQKEDLSQLPIEPSPSKPFQSVPENPASVESLDGMILRSSTETPFVKTPVREATPPTETRSWKSLQVLGQANLTYVIAQSDSAIVYVDQHAAHERVVFEKLMSQWKSGQMEVQNYLLPLDFELSEELIEALMSQVADLEKMGLRVEAKGTTLTLYSAPALIKEKSLQATLEDLAHEVLDRGGSFAMERSIAHVFETMACHSVIRAGQALSTSEMQGLLEQMDEFPLSSFCPHGRPVFVEYPFNKLERDFGRLV